MAWSQTDDKAFPEPILTQFTYSSLGNNQLRHLGQVTHVYVGSALVQVMAWCQAIDGPLSKSMKDRF